MEEYNELCKKLEELAKSISTGVECPVPAGKRTLRDLTTKALSMLGLQKPLHCHAIARQPSQKGSSAMLSPSVTTRLCH